MAVALILVDALSPAYVAPATLPTVCALAEGGWAGPMANLYAYRGIEATLFTGRFPDEHGVWGEFRPARPAPQEAGRVRLARLGMALGDWLPSDRLRLDVRYVMDGLAHPHGRRHTGNLIPPALLPAFQASVEQPLWEAGSLGPLPTLFDELRAAGRRFATVGHPTVAHDSDIAPYVRAYTTQQAAPDFWYIKFSALDALGHQFGPDPARFAPALARFDAELAAVIGALRAAYPPGDLDIVVLSDHGMSAVQQTLDVRPLLARLPLTAGRDYLYFLDSTTIRFWSESLSTRATLAAACAAVPGLHVLTAPERRACHVPDDSGTGDVLVALEEGYVVFPDFFRRQTAPHGMHGYRAIHTTAGRPYLTLEAPLAAGLPPGGTPTHADVYTTMRRRLGLTAPLAAIRQPQEMLCTSSS
jgi:hypothetical protein